MVIQVQIKRKDNNQQNQYNNKENLINSEKDISQQIQYDYLYLI